jgi:hypothetical protein
MNLLNGALRLIPSFAWMEKQHAGVWQDILPDWMGTALYCPMNTDLAVPAVHLIAIPAGGSKTIKAPFPPLSFAIERLQGLNEALHAKPGRAVSVIYSRPDDFIAVETDGLHSSVPAPLCPGQPLSL